MKALREALDEKTQHIDQLLKVSKGVCVFLSVCACVRAPECACAFLFTGHWICGLALYSQLFRGNCLTFSAPPFFFFAGA